MSLMKSKISSSSFWIPFPSNDLLSNRSNNTHGWRHNSLRHMKWVIIITLSNNAPSNSTEVETSNFCTNFCESTQSVPHLVVHWAPNPLSFWNVLVPFLFVITVNLFTRTTLLLSIYITHFSIGRHCQPFEVRLQNQFERSRVFRTV